MAKNSNNLNNLCLWNDQVLLLIVSIVKNRGEIQNKNQQIFKRFLKIEN